MEFSQNPKTFREANQKLTNFQKFKAYFCLWNSHISWPQSPAKNAQIAMWTDLNQAAISVTGKKWVVLESTRCRKARDGINWNNLFQLIIMYLELTGILHFVTGNFEVGLCHFYLREINRS